MVVRHNTLYIENIQKFHIILLAMDLDFINGLKVDELEEYLCERALKVSGRKDELVARVFCASGPISVR